MLPSLACTDPQSGDSVTKGTRTRTVVNRNGYEIEYITEKGINKSCWLTTWQDWCKKADSAVTVGQPSDK